MTFRAVARQFQIAGDYLDAAPYGSGHINDTYCVNFDQGGRPVRYIFQRINHDIFKTPVALMENIQRVTAHLAAKVAGQPEASRRVLTLMPARDGSAWHVDAEGNHWRVYILIEKARTFDAVESAGQAFQAARAFGQFQLWLADLPAPRLHDTIPDFHHTPKRFAALEKAIAANAANRAKLAQPEIEFALRHKAICGVLLEAGLPERVTHNDTKFNNVMLDDATGQGICVIDLDTVMPGLALYDFGDMVRTTTSPAKEDERDLSKRRAGLRRGLCDADLVPALAHAGADDGALPARRDPSRKPGQGLVRPLRARLQRPLRELPRELPRRARQVHRAAQLLADLRLAGDRRLDAAFRGGRRGLLFRG